MKRISIPAFFLLILAFSASKPPVLDDCLELPEEYFNYAAIQLPAHLQLPGLAAQDNTPADNPVTDAGATLGRVLFYDKKLSITNTVSCADCHKQEIAFTDDSQFSQGFQGGFTGRNSMSLVMARYYPNGHFFWDERASTLEDQILIPIEDPVEMGEDLDDLVNELQGVAYYPDLFQAAFGDPEVTSDRIARAVSQFIRSMVSYQSKYDQGRALAPPGPPEDIPFPNFTEQENRGKKIFFSDKLGNCAACHGTETFTAPGPRNNGLQMEYADPGIGGVTGNPNQVGLFKVPSLRNVALTAPYMHDGRFDGLLQVVAHYDHGVVAHPNLSPPLIDEATGQPRQLMLSNDDRLALVAFLHTLTDTAFITDERWSDPFFEGTTSAVDPFVDIGLSIFPNPAAEVLHLTVGSDAGPKQLALYDEAGRRVQTGQFQGLRHQLFVDQLPGGLYFLHVSGENWAVSRRVVLQR